MRAPRAEEFFRLSQSHSAVQGPDPASAGEVDEYVHQGHDSDCDTLPRQFALRYQVGIRCGELERSFRRSSPSAP
ncbi:hypothetical protein HEK616_81420 (plasmid) [Streptomyces nigrescens]|uniref:Uncharacterized protein n=1 Tax=Streptomyces nigrescens TaxID=1920 RepID=A0ABM8A7C9_STRNI|nr:hypothetical protein HEK616_81420 [Streptomyces nigrescens]